jgi:hypothetical protein
LNLPLFGFRLLAGLWKAEPLGRGILNSGTEVGQSIDGLLRTKRSQ